jgi:Flp pilus assembly protein TadG
MKRRTSENGTALVEAAITIPILLLLMVGIFEVGRAYETWQVLVNAAREGARMAVTPGSDSGTVRGIVHQYMADGQLTEADAASVAVDNSASLVINGNTVSASQVTVDYPFEFIILQPIARLVNPSSTSGEAITIRATALMRNEAQ